MSWVDAATALAVLAQNSQFLYAHLASRVLHVIQFPHNSYITKVAFICQDSGTRVLMATGEYAASALEARKQIPELHLVGVESIAGALDYETFLSAADPMTTNAEVDPDALAWLFYISGTTGMPKGAMLTHRNLLAMTMNYCKNGARVVTKPYPDVYQREP